jgi:hypothetical protein
LAAKESCNAIAKVLSHYDSMGKCDIPRKCCMLISVLGTDSHEIKERMFCEKIDYLVLEILANLNVSNYDRIKYLSKAVVALSVSRGGELTEEVVSNDLFTNANACSIYVKLMQELVNFPKILKVLSQMVLALFTKRLNRVINFCNCGLSPVLMSILKANETDQSISKTIIMLMFVLIGCNDLRLEFVKFGWDDFLRKYATVVRDESIKRVIEIVMVKISETS